MKQLISLIVCFTIAGNLNAQSGDRIRPGKMYDSGSEITAPRVGMKSRIPDKWAGVLPQGSEVFLLMPQNGESAEIYAAANFGDNIEDARQRWAGGVEIVTGISVKSTERSGMRGDDVYFSELEIIQHPGVKPQSRAYAEIKCGEFGNCIAMLLVYHSGNFESQIKSLNEFVDNVTFFEPTEMEQYDAFDWAEFLSSKYLTSFRYTDTSGKQNQIWLCPDGNFRSVIRRKGLAKTGDNSLTGKKSGTWRAEGVGPMGTLFLKMKKSDLEIPVEIRVEEDKFYSVASGDRVYVMENFECKN